MLLFLVTENRDCTFFRRSFFSPLPEIGREDRYDTARSLRLFHSDTIRSRYRVSVVLSSNDDQRFKLKRTAAGGARERCRFASARHQTRPKSEAFAALNASPRKGDRVLFDVSLCLACAWLSSFKPRHLAMIRYNQREISSRANYRVGLTRAAQRTATRTDNELRKREKRQL